MLDLYTIWILISPSKKTICTACEQKFRAVTYPNAQPLSEYESLCHPL